jgi:hypothetical protein
LGKEAIATVLLAGYRQADKRDLFKKLAKETAIPLAIFFSNNLKSNSIKSLLNQRFFVMLTQNMRKCDRKFQWTSSADGDSDTLLALDKYMTWFYSQIEGREPYQKMLDSHKEELPSKSSVTFALISYVCSLKPQSVLEVGCGGATLSLSTPMGLLKSILRS